MGSSPGVSYSIQRDNQKRRQIPFERRVAGYAILLVAPGLIVNGVFVWLQPWSLQSRLTFLVAESLACLFIGVALHEHIIRPLQTLANVVGALRDEDYSFRARLAIPNDALGELSLEVNAPRRRCA